MLARADFKDVNRSGNVNLEYALSKGSVPMRDIVAIYITGSMEDVHEYLPFSEEEAAVESQKSGWTKEDIMKSWRKRGQKIGEQWRPTNNAFVAVENGRIIGFMEYWQGASTLYDDFVQLDVILSEPTLSEEERTRVQTELLHYYRTCEEEALP